MADNKEDSPAAERESIVLQSIEDPASPRPAPAMEQMHRGVCVEEQEDTSCMRRHCNLRSPLNRPRHYWHSVGSALAQSYLIGWGVWGSLLAFMESLWWHFLDSKTLGISVFAIGVLFSLTTLSPILLELRPLLKLYRRLSVLLMGPVPALAMLVATVDNPYVRTTATAVASASAVAGLAATLSGPEEGEEGRRVPATTVIGVLWLQACRVGWASATPTVDTAHGNFLFWHIFGCVVACGAAGVLFARRLELVIDEHAWLAEPKLACCAGRPCWAWMPVAPMLAGAITLTLAFFNHPGAMMKYVGYAPFGLGPILVVVCIVLGWVACAFISRKKLGELQMLPAVTAALLLAGALGLFVLESFMGALLLALAFPAMWAVVTWECAQLARQMAVGRVFFCGGFLIFLHIFAWVGVLTFGNTPVFGTYFGGHPGAWGMAVVVPMVVCMVVVEYVLPKPPGNTKGEGAQLPSLDGAVRVPFAYTSDKLNMALGITLVLTMLPAVLYRLAIEKVGAAPAVGNELVVMAYNNQNGYDTDGYFNGQCFADVVRKHAADVVVVAEGDSMHLNTGNRDALEFVSSALSYYVDYGPPGYTASVGNGLLSTRPLADPDSGERYILLPKPPATDGSEGDNQDALNRYMVVTKVIVGGVEVTIGALHLEWFGDPTDQTAHVAKHFAAHVQGPAILAGDFNLEPPGSNDAMPNATAWETLKADGWLSTTPFECVANTTGADSHICKSAHSTAYVTKKCGFPCFGYQLDWILYRPAGLLRFVPGSSKVDAGIVDGMADKNCAGQACWDKEVAAGTGDVEKLAFCSDHGALIAKFVTTAK